MFDKTCETIPSCAVRVACSRERLCVCVSIGFPPCPPCVPCACVLPPCFRPVRVFCARELITFYNARAQPPCLSTNRPATPQQPSTSSPSRPHLASPASHQSLVMGITSDALHLRDYQPRAYWNTPPSARTWSRSKAGPIVVYLGT